jgi:hypothetical protein
VDQQAVKVLDKFLALTFKVFRSLVAQVEFFYSRAEKVLKAEQQRIFDETEYDRRLRQY